MLWALARELRLLYQCRTELDRGQNQNQVFRAQRVWDKRKPFVSAGLARHSLADLAALLQQAAAADRCIKGMADGRPWDLISSLVLQLALGVDGARVA